jgi:hypothetical protein
MFALRCTAQRGKCDVFLQFSAFLTTTTEWRHSVTSTTVRAGPTRTSGIQPWSGNSTHGDKKYPKRKKCRFPIVFEISEKRV